MTPSLILAALLRLAPFVGDTETVPVREERLRPVAEAIAGATRSPSEVAALVALGWHETKYAAAVAEGRCAEMPVGQRCDNGKARGVWQLHEAACRSAYAFAAGSVDSLRAEAVCAIRMLRWQAERGRAHTLTPLHAGFAGYAARAWNWSGADERVKTARAVLARLGAT